VKLGPQPVNDWQMNSFERAEYNELQGHLIYARNDYRKLLESSPNDVRALKGLGRMQAILSQFAEAQTNLTAALKLSPQDAEARYYLGVALAGSGDDAGARREWAQVGGDQTLGPMAAVEDAAALARSGDWKSALAALRASKSQLTSSLVALAALARNTEAADAGTLLARALAQDPADSAARFEQSLQGADATDLWDHLGHDAERVLEIADLYMHWGLYRDAELVLQRSYPSFPETELEPGAVPPGSSPLISYYLGYCEELQKHDPADYFRGGSQMPVTYVFPNRAGSRPVLEAAVRANGEDANAHYLLGLWFLNAGLTEEGGREVQAAQKLRPTIGEARALLSAMKLSMVAPPKETPAPRTSSPRTPAPRPATNAETKAPAVPASPGNTPVEIAATALMAAAEGDLARARGYFTAANFPAEKQDDAVREAYIELELQRLLGLAAAGKCQEVERLLTDIGGFDKNLPFTFHSFNNMMKGPRFQYFLGQAESVCDEKAAYKRWDKVAHMKAEMTSPDFAYPFFAATRIMAASSTSASLENVQRYLQTARAGERGVLLYNQGLLLVLAGKRRDAMDCFRNGDRASQTGMLHYLNTLALRTLEKQ